MTDLPSTNSCSTVPPINFCSQCGERVEQKIPQGETLLRAVCPACQAIHYQNPKMVAGCIPEWKDQILLCRRAIEPRLGFWTFPAGFMELGESTEEAAARETLEEANAKIEIQSLFALFSLPYVNQVYIVYRAVLQDLDFGPGEESLEVQLMHIQDIPWDQLAFPVIKETLHHYANNSRQNPSPAHFGIIPKHPHTSSAFISLPK